MPTYTPRLSLPIPEGTESPNGPTDFAALAALLDGLVGPYAQGILANQPVSTSGTPGIQGRLYLVTGDSTDANNGILWLDYGTGWWPINGGYQSYIPQLTGGVTNPSLGSGAVAAARYCQTGKTVHYYGNITFGSGMAGGSGNWYLSAPVTPRTFGYLDNVGVLIANEASTNYSAQGFLETNSSGTFQPIANGGIEIVDLASSGTVAVRSAILNGLTATNPWTWADGDQLAWNAVYEAA